jgi:hypothetical protein
MFWLGKKACHYPNFNLQRTKNKACAANVKNVKIWKVISYNRQIIIMPVYKTKNIFNIAPKPKVHCMCLTYTI